MGINFATFVSITGFLLAVPASGQALTPLGQVLQKDVSVIKISPRGDVMVSASSFSNVITLWNVQTRSVQSSLSTGMGIDRMAFAPDGKILAIGGTGPQVEVWNLGARKRAHQIDTSLRYVSSFNFSPDGNLLVVGSNLGATKIYDLRTGDLFRWKGEAAADTAVFTPDGVGIIMFNDGNVVHKRLFDGALLGEFKSKLDDRSQLLVTPENQHLIISNPYGLEVWNLPEQTNVWAMEPHGWYDSFYSVAVSADGKSLALAQSMDNNSEGQGGRRLSIVDIKNGHVLGETSGQTIWSLTYTPDGRTVAAASEHNINFWDVSPFLHLDANLFVSVEPSNATLWINGSQAEVNPEGLIPVLTDVPLQVRVTAPGFNDHNTTMTLKPGQTKSVNISLKRALGGVSLITSPQGATVVIGGEVKGKTPLTLTDLPTETFEFTFTLDDHQTSRGTFTVQGNTTVVVKQTLTETPGLKFITQPAGAQVWLGNKMMCSATPCTVNNLKPGPVDFILKLAGHQDFKGRAFVPDSGKGEVEEILSRK